MKKNSIKLTYKYYTWRWDRWWRITNQNVVMDVIFYDFIYCLLLFGTYIMDFLNFSIFPRFSSKLKIFFTRKYIYTKGYTIFYNERIRCL
jgi:hypothetical protein